MRIRRKRFLKKKIKEYNYFKPSYKLDSSAINFSQSCTGMILTFMALIMVIMTVHQGYKSYTDVQSISISSTNSFKENSVRVNMIQNQFYPIMRIKPYFQNNFYTSAQILQ